MHVVLPGGVFVKPVAESHAIIDNVVGSAAAGSLAVRNGRMSISNSVYFMFRSPGVNFVKLMILRATRLVWPNIGYILGSFAQLIRRTSFFTLIYKF